MKKLEEIDLNPSENLGEVIEGYGFNFALVVLAIYTNKFTAFVVIFMMTGHQEGAAGVYEQLVFTISCNAVNAYRKESQVSNRVHMGYVIRHAFLLLTNHRCKLSDKYLCGYIIG